MQQNSENSTSSINIAKQLMIDWAADLAKGEKISEVDYAKLLPHVHASDENGFTILHWATKFGMERLVEFLLTNNADVNAQDREGNTALHEATRLKFKRIVEVLLQHKKTKQLPNKNNDYPIHLCCNKEINKMTSLLLSFFKNKVDINVQNAEGKTPLYLALSENITAPVINLFLNYFADYNLSPTLLGAPSTLELMARKTMPIILRFCMAAINKNDIQVLELIGNYRPEIYTTHHDTDQSTIIHHLAKAGHVAFLAKLLESKKITKNDIRTKKDGIGANAMHYAAWGGQISVIEWFLKEEIITIEDIKIQEDNQKSTALHYVGCGGNIQFVDWLLNHRIINKDDFTKKNNIGCSVITYAINWWQFKFLQWLLEQKFIIRENITTEYSEKRFDEIHQIINFSRVTYFEWLFAFDPYLIFPSTMESLAVVKASTFVDKEELSHQKENNHIFKLLDIMISSDEEKIQFRKKILSVVLNYTGFSSVDEQTAFFTKCHKLFPQVFTETLLSNYYMQQGNYEEVYGICYSVVRNNSSSNEAKDNANLQIAELLFQGKIEFDDDNVFEHGVGTLDLDQIEAIIKDAKSDEERQKNQELYHKVLFKRVTQAYSYVIDNKLQQAKQLELVFNHALSANKIHDYANQDPTWLPEATLKFAQYYKSKEDCSDTIKNIIINQQTRSMQTLMKQMQDLQVEKQELKASKQNDVNNKDNTASLKKVGIFSNSDAINREDVGKGCHYFW